jgi:hypothetical protein
LLLLEVSQPDPEKSEFLRSQTFLLCYAYQFALGRHQNSHRLELAELVNAYFVCPAVILSLLLVLRRAVALGRALHNLTFGCL